MPVAVATCVGGVSVCAADDDDEGVKVAPTSASDFGMTNGFEAFARNRFILNAVYDVDDTDEVYRCQCGGGQSGCGVYGFNVRVKQ
jgi:hypothetical protein